jgi:hypothetical protein
MLDRLQDFALRASRTWWLYLTVCAVFFGSIRLLTAIGERFRPLAGGVLPFDLQNGLTPVDVYTQLASYTPQAVQLYWLFNAIDYVFPLFAGLFVVATTAFALRYARPAWYARLVSGRWLLWLLLASAFDWAENLTAIVTITWYPDEVAALPVLLVTFKQAKLAGIAFSNGVMGLALLLAAATWVARTVRR